jgi:hypothetical protein
MSNETPDKQEISRTDEIVTEVNLKGYADDRRYYELSSVLYDRARQLEHELADKTTLLDAITRLNREHVRMLNEAPSATQESPVTPEQFTDLLKRIAVRMGGHTIPVIHGPAWHNFMGLLRQVKPYECGIGPMPSEGNSSYVGEKK